jgi:hypothetical protein
MRTTEGFSIMKSNAAFILVAAMLAAACSSGDDDDAMAAQGLEAPMLMEVVPMEGALHLTWMNMQKDCDSVEGERKMEHHADYEVAFSVPGTVDNKMDTAATDDMMYTYRMRCKKGTAYSSYSNEMSANPHDM